MAVQESICVLTTIFFKLNVFRNENFSTFIIIVNLFTLKVNWLKTKVMNC